MNIKELAEQAGIYFDRCNDLVGEVSDLERFAELVAAAEREAGAAEADHWQSIDQSHKCGSYIAAAIRARGDKHE